VAVADREVNVRVVVSSATGPDQVSPAVDQQIRKVEALQQAAAKPVTVAAQPGPAPPVPTLAPPGVRSAPPVTVVPPMPAPPPGITSPTATPPRLPPITATPPALVPPRPPPPTTGGLPAVTAAPLVQVGRAAVAGLASGSPTAALGVLSALPGPIAAVGIAAGATAALVVSLEGAFRTFRPAVAELTAEMNRSRGVSASIRQTGIVTGEQARSLMTPEEQREYQEHERAGNVAGMRGVMQRVQQRGARQEARLEGMDLGQIRTRVNLLVQQALAAKRAGSHGLAARLLLQARRLLEENGLPVPAEIANGTILEQTPIQAEQAVEAATTGALSRATATRELGTASLGPGGMPSLRPGAMSLADLPNLFQSRQGGDILDIHQQIQQEAVRDARQQAQFNQQMELWQKIYEEIARRGGVVAAPAPVVS
jgi:hypothetical protein